MVRHPLRQREEVDGAEVDEEDDDGVGAEEVGEDLLRAGHCRGGAAGGGGAEDSTGARKGATVGVVGAAVGAALDGGGAAAAAAAAAKTTVVPSCCHHGPVGARAGCTPPEVPQTLRRP